ncbi:MAG TPA: HEPN domain-containing protein [Gammaproteobacteria bacterium]|nr:HEPN domain-containing protein [Gammaproteobacteria bacterium]
MKNLNQFNSYNWQGLFFYTDESLKFNGKLIYQPEDGFYLEFFLETSQKIKPTGCLHGVLENGQKCTLFGNFNMNLTGMNINIFTYRERVNFGIFGKHVHQNQLFCGIIADFTFFQEFCCPKGLRKNVKKAELKDKKLFHNKDIEISIINYEYYEWLNQDFVDRFNTSDQDIFDKIQDFFNALKVSHGNYNIAFRTDVKSMLRILATNKKNINELFLIIKSLYEFLSFLLYLPVRPIEMRIIIETKDKTREDQQLPMLIGFTDFRNGILELSKSEIVHQHLIITPFTVDMKTILTTWMKKYFDQYNTFIQKIANYTGFSPFYEYEVRSEYVFLTAILEEIYHNTKDRNKKYNYENRYSYAIDLYSGAALQKTLKNLLKIDKENITLGKAIGNLRNEIAHAGKPKNHMLKLSSLELFDICKCLDIIITAYIYKDLGIPSKVIESFKEKEISKI